MKFFIWINQPKSIEWELSLQQASLFACIYELPSWAEQVVVGNETFYWCSKTVFAAELPLFVNKIDTVYRWLNQLQEKGLIVVKKQGKKDLIKLTSKGKEWNEKSDDRPNSDSSPTIFGSSSGKTPDSRPTYPNTNTDHNTKISIEQKIKNSKIKFCKKVIDWAKNNQGDPPKYPKLMYFDFAKYWTEQSESGKMRFQDQKFFEVGRRLATWFGNADNKKLSEQWEAEKKISSINSFLRTLL